MLPKQDIAKIQAKIKNVKDIYSRIAMPIQLIFSELCCIILNLNNTLELNLNQEEFNKLVLGYYQGSIYKPCKVNENTRTLYVNKMIFNIIDRNINKLNNYYKQEYKKINKKYKNKTTKQFIKYMAIQAIKKIIYEDI
jgi:ABC-type anion transport system duplicated permease subunit